MILTFIVTLAHILALFLFSLQRNHAEKKIPTKIQVHICDEKKRIEEPKKGERKKEVQNQKTQETYSETVEIEPLTLEPLPEIEPLKKHNPLNIQTIKAPPHVKKEVKSTPLKPKISSQKEKVKTKEKKKPSSPKISSTQSLSHEKKGDEKLLRMMKEGLTKIDNIPATLKNKAPPPTSSSTKASSIAKLMSESLEMSPKELSYAEELALCLRHHLQFPHEGTMKLTLNINDKGKVLDFSILSSSSAKNKELAEKALASFAFPPFGSRFSEKSKSFTLMLNIE